MDNLTECPCCGGPAEMVHGYSPAKGAPEYIAGCAPCDAYFGNWEETEELAAAKWNTRSTKAAARVLLGDEIAIGQIAHFLTGLITNECCFRTGGWKIGAENAPTPCECRVEARAVLTAIAEADDDRG